MSKPKVGIFGLTGCAGDQLVILNCEDRLFDLVALIDIRDFLMASSQNQTDCALDIALVEGAVLSRRDTETLKGIRARAKTLVALGTCAVWGGIPTMDRGLDRDPLLEAVYGEKGLDYDSTSAKALREVVQVDLNIPGCPIEPDEFLNAIAALLNGDPPLIPQYPVCTECRMKENNCLLTGRGDLCCGANTAAGCGARCPSHSVPCIGCRGPLEDANALSLAAVFQERGITQQRAVSRLTTFGPIGASR